MLATIVANLHKEKVIAGVNSSNPSGIQFE